MDAVKTFYKSTDRGLECTICPNACTLQDGQRGVCGVRERQGDAIVPLTYRKNIGLRVDPIEKKPLYHFLPGSKTLSIGSLGCNLRCAFCQNDHLSRPDGRVSLVSFTPQEVVQAAIATGSKSVAFTYNEPVIAAETVIETAHACRKAGLKNILVTNGYVQREAREAIFAEIDAANVDLKAFTDDYYREICKGHLDPVLETLEFIAKSTTWLEVTTLILPGKNDDFGTMSRQAEWMREHLGAEVPLHLSAFHPACEMLNLPVTTADTLRKLRFTAASMGLYYVYTGNIRARDGESTCCPRCGELLLIRNRCMLMEDHLDHGKCAYCGYFIKGVFENNSSKSIES